MQTVVIPSVSSVQVVAHRGASADAPEHTLTAYRRAIEAGADALECDVRLTRDGHLICVHDRRVDRTSTGRGPVSVHKLAELNRLDWGSWHERDSDRPRPGSDRPAGYRAADRPAGRPGGLVSVPDLDTESRTLLTLRRLCEAVADAPRPVELAIEAKHPTRYAGRVERRLVDLLRHFGWADPTPRRPSPVRFMSFSVVAIRRMQQVAPNLPTVLLFHRVPLAFADGTLPYGVPIAGPKLAVLHRDPAYVGRAHENGTQVHVWTVDADEDLRYCAELGVDALITNRPRRALELLRPA